MNFVAKSLSEHSGKPSTSRIAALLAATLILGTWTAVSVKKWELQPLSVEQVGITLGALGLKSWQRGREDNKQTEPTK